MKGSIDNSNSNEQRMLNHHHLFLYVEQSRKDYINGRRILLKSIHDGNRKYI